MICQKQVNQDAVVILGIPHAQLRKNLDSPLACRCCSHQRQHIQCWLHCKADFPVITEFRLRDRVLNSSEGCSGKCAPHGQWPGKKVPQYSLKVHLPSPRGAAATKATPTPAETSATPETAGTTPAAPSS